jgi:membrane protease YdiL (CAAX protease family)
MEPSVWSNVVELALVRTDRGEPMFAVPVDARMLAGAAHNEHGSCVTFASVDSLSIDTNRLTVALDALVRESPSAILDVPLRARVLARRRLESTDLAIVMSVLALSIGGVLVFTRISSTAETTSRPSSSKDGLRLAAGFGCVLLVGIALAFWGARGSNAGLGTGLALALTQVGIAVAFVNESSLSARIAALGMVSAASRHRTVLGLAIAPFIGFGLFVLAQVLLRQIPSDGTAPIEAFVRWPSGMLSIAMLAVTAPIAEEVFFRGFVYGALRGQERHASIGRGALAVIGTTVLFAAAHLPQDWGNWGGVTAIMVAGLGFALLRAVFRTTLVPCVAHLVYNGLLAMSILAAGAA